jgi:hypothetical protein
MHSFLNLPTPVKILLAIVAVAAIVGGVWIASR